MDLDTLLEPISDDVPCGPDLNATLDPEYDEYYFGALGRLPGYFIQPGVERPDGSRSPDKTFDAKDVDIAAEVNAITGLLTRTRDLRLLVLRAQWEILAGRLGPMADAIDTVAALLEAYPEAVHPTTRDGLSDRRDAISDLNQQVTIVLPLMFTGLTGTTEVTLRKIRVASGNGVTMQNEQDLTTGPLLESLGASANRKKVDEAHASLLKIAHALARIDLACQSHPTTPFSPALDKVRPTVTEMLEVITSARPDLRGADIASVAAAEPKPKAAGSGLQMPPANSPPAPAQPPKPASPMPEVVSHVHARRILEACERYFRRAEPSSAALLLVTQARLLIGRPLIEALQTLLPQRSSRAVVDFGPQTGFALDADRLLQLTAALPEGLEGDTPPTPDPGPEPRVRNGDDVAIAIRTVEDYFRQTERSSPVPILLQRARSYLDRDFQSLVDELMPRAEGNLT